jgi:hypothetical protein
MATTATFSPGAGILSVFGEGLGKTVTFSFSRNAAETILVNGGAVAGLGGDEGFGALPAATLFGGSGGDGVEPAAAARSLG